MRGARGERGQILAVVALALVALLGVAAFSIDVGYAYYAKRQLQSATDAAALAGRPGPAERHHRDRDGDHLRAATTRPRICPSTSRTRRRAPPRRSSPTGCVATVNPNQLTVAGTASTNTWFAKIFGINHFDVSTHANACSPCSSTPVDIVIAVDRTGSMCITDRRERQLHRSRQRQGRHPHDAHGSQSTVRADRHGRVPAGPDDRERRVRRRYNSLGGNGYNGYDAANRGYLTDTINSNYKTGTVLNTSSGLYLHTVDGPATSCIQAGGNTSYSEALRQARAELAAHGRAERPRLHRLPDRRRGQHRQRLQRHGSDLLPGQPRRPVAVPHGHQPGQSVQGRKA